MQFHSANAAISQAFKVRKFVLYAGVNINLHATRLALIASLKKKGKTFWHAKIKKSFLKIQAILPRKNFPTSYKSAY
jgi:hypothetical protein